ncbi:hypothetical protein [Gracilibacillus oryzae]|uniref:hypothetical protein n=1 Tax=Gracilibacillus oryzae TaxID=1672701 RepID=UPI001D189BB7|nr:hypothetical protein [Gracilibacillus oryzae]
MISIKDALIEQFRLTKEDGNVISKRQFFSDIYHPTNDGHKIMADCLANLFSETKKEKKVETDISLDKLPVIGDDFRDIQLLDRKDNNNAAVTIEVGGFTETDSDLQTAEMDYDELAKPQFPYNWMHTAASVTDHFKIRINSSSLILIYKDSASKEFGEAEIFVDGQFMKTINPHLIKWTHCHAAILYNEKECKEREVEIRMTPSHKDKCFTILAFGYTV